MERRWGRNGNVRESTAIRHAAARMGHGNITRRSVVEFKHECPRTEVESSLPPSPSTSTMRTSSPADHATSKKPVSPVENESGR